MEWITDVAVPIVLGLLAAFGATWYSNERQVKRLQRETDDRAADAIRAYIRALHDTSDYLEATAMRFGVWDPTKDVINHGGQQAVRDVSRPRHRIFIDSTFELRIGTFCGTSSPITGSTPWMERTTFTNARTAFKRFSIAA